MKIPGAVFEVETRFSFKDREEAFRAVPFLEENLSGRMDWSSAFYGIDIFRSGRLLRKSEVTVDGRTMHFICWKGEDFGGLINIRPEITEEVTAGIVGSGVMTVLGGPADLEGPDRAVREMERLGHESFMSFAGTDFFGYFEPLDIYLKLMICPYLDNPILVEIEKIAETEQDAARFEADIIRICEGLGLRDRLIREEPPAMLYKREFRERNA